MLTHEDITTFVQSIGPITSTAIVLGNNKPVISGLVLTLITLSSMCDSTLVLPLQKRDFATVLRMCPPDEGHTAGQRQWMVGMYLKCVSMV